MLRKLLEIIKLGGLLVLLNIFIVEAALAYQSPNNMPLSDKDKVVLDAKALTIPIGYTKNLQWDLILDSLGRNGSKITWVSNHKDYISDAGRLLKRSLRGKPKVQVKVTATITSGKSKDTKSFSLNIAYQEQNFDAYLFAYFEGSGEREKQEQLRFGVSANAINWFALNNNQPIIESSELSQTGGVRDPHILRAEDEKTFLMVATDMFTVKNGWDQNPGIVMLKSADLLTWSSGIIDLEKSYPTKFANIKWVWAPQTIYDPAADKYLVYFTVRYKDNLKLDFYAAYANANFTAFEEEPKLMFSAKYGAIDGDIIYKDGTYHFYYKGNTKDENGKEIRNGIQQATAKTLNGPWIEEFKYLDAYSAKGIVVEGSSVFKLNGADTHILMYDLYKNLRYEFQRSTDLYNFSATPESFTKDFNPRHGSVIGITKEEAVRLNQKWGGVPAELLTKQNR